MKNHDQIVLDTNAYRGLANKISQYPEHERQKKINLIRARLLKNNIAIHNNYWVIVEILNHLEKEEDPHYNECALALKILCFISTTPLLGNNISCNETIETEIFKTYNQEQYLKHKKNEIDILHLASQFVENGRSAAFLKFIPEISKQLAEYKREKLIELNEKKRKLKKDIKEQGLPLNFPHDPAFQKDMLCFIVEPLVGEDFETLEPAVKDTLWNRFFMGIARRAQVIHNAITSSRHSPPLSGKFSNHFIDMAICDDFPLMGTNILVTDDGKNKTEGSIKSMFEYYGQENRCLSLDTFLREKLGLSEGLEGV